MVYYRSCPKCRGDMHSREDVYGNFRECLQCGLIQDLKELANKMKQTVSDRSDKKGAAA
tara:strand:- start:940 stop:1116 length:177 start_codon:yes stop_codon:yes gene_type:complete